MEALEPVIVIPEVKDKKKRKRRPKPKSEEKKDPKRYGFTREYKEITMEFL
jgi:hypothetical protein